ncbi:hypothetical protein [Mycetocola zhujimingii]|uniref:hypothetical protein n=1 Tax=Mycetocola zhujimingii TaxID=2079792 RepID=UPI0039F6B7CD
MCRQRQRTDRLRLSGCNPRRPGSLLLLQPIAGAHGYHGDNDESPSADLADSSGQPVAIRAISYFRWANREDGGMRVWLPTIRAPLPPTAILAVGVASRHPAGLTTQERKRNEA